MTFRSYEATQEAIRDEIRLDMLYDSIFLYFNFYKVREVMRFLDWKWFGSEDYPTVKEMQNVVKGLITDSYFSSKKSRNPHTTGTGGFYVCVDYKENTCKLDFIVETADNLI